MYTTHYLGSLVAQQDMEQYIRFYGAAKQPTGEYLVRFGVSTVQAAIAMFEFSLRPGAALRFDKNVRLLGDVGGGKMKKQGAEATVVDIAADMLVLDVQSA